MRSIETTHREALASTDSPHLPYRRIFRTWWPLAASWLLMSAELPVLSAVIARLPDPEIHLAAYGGIVFPLALIIESPIIMLLAASTALSKDWASYAKLRRFMMAAGASLTGLHILVAFTPLYDLVARVILRAPAEIIEPARWGLMIMTPWTWSIAYRRFNQGVLIRFDRSHTIWLGTLIRMSADLLVLAAGYFIGTLPGIVVATSAVISGVISEAIYVGIVVRPVLRTVRSAPAVAEPLTLESFLKFYIPLAMTSLLALLVQPIGSAALGRMPRALISLAVWPVVSGLVYMFRSAGVAYNEVVVALLDQPGSYFSLRRYTFILAAGVTTLILLVTATPLSHVWFQEISGLSPELAALATSSLWFALLLPGLSVFQSWYQGAILHSRHTNAITEAVFAFLVVCSLLLVAGILWGQAPGLYIGWTAFVLATLVQTLWLYLRSRETLRNLSASQDSRVNR